MMLYSIINIKKGVDTMAKRLTNGSTIKRNGLTFEHETDYGQIYVDKGDYTASITVAYHEGVLTNSKDGEHKLTIRESEGVNEVINEAEEDGLY